METMEHFATHLSFQRGLWDRECGFSTCADWSQKAP